MRGRTSPQTPQRLHNLLLFYRTVQILQIVKIVCVLLVLALLRFGAVSVLCVAVGFFHRPTAFRAFPPVSNSSKIFQAPISSASGGDKRTKLCRNGKSPQVDLWCPLNQEIGILGP